MKNTKKEIEKKNLKCHTQIWSDERLKCIYWKDGFCMNENVNNINKQKKFHKIYEC
jgi:hypothetical protein